MSEENSLINTYVGMYTNNGLISEALQPENSVVRFIIPAAIDFVITLPDIESAYTLEEYQNDVKDGVGYGEIKNKLIQAIENIAKRRVATLNADSKGFEIVTKIEPKLEKAQWFRMTPTKILAKYKKISDENINNELDQDYAHHDWKAGHETATENE